MSLQKGATFHSPPSTPVDDIKVPSLPQRSETTLEDVVDAHRRRVALTLGDINRSLAAFDLNSPASRQSFPDEAEPVPQGTLHRDLSSPATEAYGPIMNGVMEKQLNIGRHSLRPRHRGRVSTKCSDSGLGSSIASASGKQSAETKPTSVTDEPVAKSVGTSTITRSAASKTAFENLPRLSAKASNRVREHVLRPLLAKPSLKDFHSIIKDCPKRIHAKEIVCLRDLEKTLIFMAPVSDLKDDVVDGVAHWFALLKVKAKSAALYLDFCLTSIRCIQATVEFLSDRERTRPSDRPYTNGYFVDLLDQIKQYAQQIQATKEKEAKGEALDEMDPEQLVTHSLSQTLNANTGHRSDEIKLHGGLTKNGRPAELIRVKKNGNAVSMSTGKPVDLDEDDNQSVTFKRSLSAGLEDDESVLRSMARRKRSATAAELAPKRCREPGCEKEFKRPCDLTKHEKTHSRPFKCAVETCKYHEYGWPTEKELDRHNNDKHSAAPPLFECHFKPCPYRSKRESNCKQHMEKAHGWQYVRSKNNSRHKNKESIDMNALPTPQLTNIHTPSSDGNMVHTPSDDEMAYDSSAFNRGLHFPAFRQATEVDNYATQQLHLDYSPVSDSRHSTNSSNHHSPTHMTNAMPVHRQIQDTVQPSYQNNMDWSLFDNEDLYSANVRLPVIHHNIYRHIQQPFATSGIPLNPVPAPAPHISPTGHGNTMLYDGPASGVDEGFGDFKPHLGRSMGASNDFQLYPTSTGGSGSGTVSSSAPSGLFGEITQTCGGCQPALMTNPGFPPVTTQDILNYYAASSAPAVHHTAGGIPWPMEDQFSSGYRSH